MTKHYTALVEKFQQIQQINNLLSIIHWDYAVNVQKNSAYSRQQEITNLSTISHNLITDNRLKDLILNTEQEIPNLNDWQKANFREMKKIFEHTCLISEDLNARYSSTTTKCEMLWRDARKNNDFVNFQGHLQEVITITKEIAEIKSQHFNMTAYDTMLDQYLPDTKAIGIKKVYNLLKKDLPEIITKALDTQNSKSILPSKIAMPISEQKRLAKKVMEVMGFDFTRGRLDTSTHPFCGGTKSDVRITTRYDEKNFLSAIMGIIHETGHALYELNLPQEYIYQPVGMARSIGFHESQSLIMEYQIGKSVAFLELLAKILRDDFACNGKEYEVENLYNAANFVQPSYIRVDADEVTYALHVILRFEIEEALFNNSIVVADIPTLWNDKMKEYLGIVPSSDTEGCLQDVHWPSGAFGYFPAYTYGAIIASMSMNKIKQTTPNIEQNIRNGDFNEINALLNQNIRQFGSYKNSTDLLFSATNYNELQPQIFLEYLTNKFSV